MTTIFGTQTTEGLEETNDTLGGGGFIRESGAVTGTITAMYAGKAANSKAMSVTIILKDDAGKEYRNTVWVTNRDNKNFYVDKKDESKKRELPGWTTIDELCLVTTNQGLAEQVSEEKTMNIYDFDAKKEIPTAVQMFTGVLGKKVTLGVLKETKNKQKKGDDGVYVDTDESRDENVIDKIFHHPSNLTVVEARKQIQTPAFYPAWVEKNTGQTRDRRKVGGAQGGRSGRPGMPPKAGESAKATNSLFG